MLSREDFYMIKQMRQQGAYVTNGAIVIHTPTPEIRSRGYLLS
ncbi:transposase [Escherichia coli]|nr:transposase [Escherichia coli]